MLSTTSHTTTLFSYSDAIPTDLPAFPTRRSSDLRSRSRSAARIDRAAYSPVVRSATGKPALTGVPVADLTTGRSEEHTSELQSRRDLVCRLLLEKKNNNTER